MATFQEWWDENYGEFSGQSVQSKIKMRMAYDVGVEHQLTKVDEQQKRIDELQAKVDELEKSEFKLAKIKAIIRENPKILESILLREIKQALKGGEV